MRYFEKISFEQFKKDVCDKKSLYDEYTLPVRSTFRSAGYDFKALADFVLKPGEIKKVPLGIKVFMESDEMFLLIVRSSVGFKHNVRLCNQVGVIDSDYYNNATNEGHMWVKLQNHGQEDYIVKKGDRIVQGIFTKYLTVENDKPLEKVRVGGTGSTNEEED